MHEDRFDKNYSKYNEMPETFPFKSFSNTLVTKATKMMGGDQKQGNELSLKE